MVSGMWEISQLSDVGFCCRFWIAAGWVTGSEIRMWRPSMRVAWMPRVAGSRWIVHAFVSNVTVWGVGAEIDSVSMKRQIQAAR